LLSLLWLTIYLRQEWERAMLKELATSILGLALAAASVPASADVKAGVDAWSRGDYNAAVTEWRPLAINGDADAQFNLGQAYKLGRGVPTDFKLAENWYRKAANQGHLQAEDNLGLILFQNNDRQAAIPFIEKSAARGEPRAQYILGTALFNGDLVKKDWVRAYAMMTRASAAGLSQASTSLAQMDRYIPLEQRQRGLTLARDLESNAARPQFANVPQAPIRPKRVPASNIAKTDIPASVQAPPAEQAPSADAAVSTDKPAMVKPAMAKPTTAKLAAVKPAPAPVGTGPTWRVQLGAFGDQGNARALWGKLQGRVSALGGLQPYYVKAGNVMRLQAGPIGGKAAAERVCASVKASGQSCLPVGP
jgi:uncharacterized protein